MTQRPGVRLSSTSRRLWWAVAAGVVVAVLVALVVWRGSDGGGSSESAGESDVPTTLPSTDGLGSPVATPSPGQTEPGVAQTPTATPDPVRAQLGDVARLDRGVRVEVVRFESVQGKARGAGERAGPGVRFTVELTNDTSSDLDLRATTVTAYVGPDRVPANQLSGPGAEDFPTSVGPGDSATGVFVFRMPPRERDDVRVDVSYRGESPTAVFTGSVA
jgi:hypothetical protein